MPRPCACGNVTGPEWSAGQCRLCWLAEYDPRYRRLWGPAPATPVAPDTPAPRPDPAHPRGRPGTALKEILASLGLHASGGCGCGDRAAQMDAWGVEGCRSHREEILAWLRQEQAKAGWAAKLKAAALAVATGLAFRLDPLDPAPGLLDEALRRAEN